MTATDILDLLRCVAFETGNPKALAAFERLAKVERRGGSDPSDKKDENLQV